MAGHIGYSGIQAHSIGPLFPLTVRGVGDTLQAFNCYTGEAGVRYAYDPDDDDSFYEAHRNAEADCRRRLDEDRCRSENRAYWYGLAD